MEQPRKIAFEYISLLARPTEPSWLNSVHPGWGGGREMADGGGGGGGLDTRSYFAPSIQTFGPEKAIFCALFENNLE